MSPASLRILHETARGYGGRLRSFDPRPEALRIADLVGGSEGVVLPTAAAHMSVVLFTAAWGAMVRVLDEPIGLRTQLRLDWLRTHYAP
jgi:hypothetical protein